MLKFISISFLGLTLLSGCASQSTLKTTENFDQLEAAKTRVSLGLTYLKSGNYSQSKFNLDKALEFAPRSADANFAMAYYYQSVGELEQAERAYQYAMDLEPQNANIANSYGAFLCQNGSYEKAKTYFLKAVNTSSYISSAETYENLALCSQSQGKPEDAIRYLRSAVNHQPGRSNSLFLLAKSLVDSQHWQEAQDILRRYEKTAKVSPQSLSMAMKISKGLGNYATAKGYSEMLLRIFPTHPETKAMLAEKRKAQSTDYRPLKQNRKLQVPQSEPVVMESQPKEKLVKAKTTAKKQIVVLVPEPESDAEQVVAVVSEKISQDEPAQLSNKLVEPEVQVSEELTEPSKIEQSPELKADISTQQIVEDATEQLAELKEESQITQTTDNVVAQVSEATDATEVIEERDDNSSFEPLEAETDEVLPITAPELKVAATTPEKSVEQNVESLSEQVTEQVESMDDSKIENSDGLIITDTLESKPEQELEQQEEALSEQDKDLLSETPEKNQFHTVVKGDNLYRISLRYNVKVKRLMEWNDLADSPDIYIGRKLIVVAPSDPE